MSGCLDRFSDSLERLFFDAAGAAGELSVKSDFGELVRGRMKSLVALGRKELKRYANLFATIENLTAIKKELVVQSDRHVPPRFPALID